MAWTTSGGSRAGSCASSSGGSAPSTSSAVFFVALALSEFTSGHALDLFEASPFTSHVGFGGGVRTHGGKRRVHLWTRVGDNGDGYGQTRKFKATGWRQIGVWINQEND